MSADSTPIRSAQEAPEPLFTENDLSALLSGYRALMESGCELTAADLNSVRERVGRWIADNRWPVASDARDGGEDDDRIVDADWCECGVFLPDVTDGIASHRVGCARFPAPKRYVVRSDRAEMYEDKDGNWVAWSDYERLLVSRSPSSGAETKLTVAQFDNMLDDFDDACRDREKYLNHENRNPRREEETKAEWQGTRKSLMEFVADARDGGEDAGLPPGESPQRDAVCDALSEALLYCGNLAYHAGERTTVDLRDSGHVRALARLLTTRDPDGDDGWHGEQTRKLWARIGVALATRGAPGGR